MQASSMMLIVKKMLGCISILSHLSPVPRDGVILNSARLFLGRGDDDIDYTTLPTQLIQKSGEKFMLFCY